MGTTNKKADVVQAAMEIIAKEGFHNAPTSLIAKQANVGMGTIYRYFKSKDELIHEIYSERIALAREYVLTDYDSKGSIEARYMKLCRNFFDFMVNNPLDYGFFEQYVNSPYGLKVQLKDIDSFKPGEGSEVYPVLELFIEGQKSGVIKNMELALLIALTESCIFTLVRHQIHGEMGLDDRAIEQFFSATWETVSQ
jgi:AcrR family transcriptional regulator